MRVHFSTRFAAMAVLVGALGCAGNKTREDTSAAAGAKDSTTTDTLSNQNPPGYRGMERDTTMAPPSQQQPSDTFLQKQGTGAPQDTLGYSGAERIDTTARQSEMDTTSFHNDATGAAGAAGDTTSMTRDSSWTKSSDTTGYNPTQQPGDSVSQ
ncbi:MAG: hypothetical protein ABI703_00290 [Gemmatimonadales bacterium]